VRNVAFSAAPLALLASLTMAACSGKDPYNPGTPIGTFHVTGALAVNQCGDASGAVDPWTFDIKLNKDGTTLYWMQGGLPVSGVLDAHLHTSMTSTDTRTIHGADPQHRVPFCGITRDDAVDLTMAADLASFTGSLAYTFSPSDGSDCTDQLTTAGGSYATLPCEIHYTLTAVKTAGPPQAESQ
jgi:hypothetical protein